VYRHRHRPSRRLPPRRRRWMPSQERATPTQWFRDSHRARRTPVRPDTTAERHPARLQPRVGQGRASDPERQRPPLLPQEDLWAWVRQRRASRRGRRYGHGGTIARHPTTTPAATETRPLTAVITTRRDDAATTAPAPTHPLDSQVEFYSQRHPLLASRNRVSHIGASESPRSASPSDLLDLEHGCM
jgi:hypothetical protein